MRILLVLLFLFVGGCRKSSEKTIETPEGTVKVDGDKVTVQTTDGTATVVTEGDKTVVRTTEKGKEGTYTVGDKKAPEGFPLPIIVGATIENSAHIAQADSPEAFQLSMKVALPPGQVADFYEKALKDKGLEVGRSETKGDETVHFIVSGRSEKVEANVMVVQERGNDPCTTAIYWSAEK